MAKIYDLSVSLRPDHLENSELKLNSISHEEAAGIFAKRHQVKVSDLLQSSFFSTEQIELRSHLGTHLDAPYHFYPTSEGRPAKFIDEVPLEWCIADGVVLDFRHKKPSAYITEYDIAAALERIHHTLKPGDIVSLWTGGTDTTTTTLTLPSPPQALTVARLITCFASASRSCLPLCHHRHAHCINDRALRER